MKHEYGKRFYRGEIYYIEREPSYESEMRSGRPAIIVSNDMNNEHSPNVEIVYLTTKPKANLPTHVNIYSSKVPSTALCEGVFTVSKSRIGNYINQISVYEQKRIDDALAISICNTKDLKTYEFLDKWAKATDEMGYDIVNAASFYDCEEDEPEYIGSTEVITTERMDKTEDTEDIDNEQLPKLEDKTLGNKNELSVIEKIELNPEYIKVCAERDTFKSLYQELLKQLMRVGKE